MLNCDASFNNFCWRTLVHFSLIQVFPSHTFSFNVCRFHIVFYLLLLLLLLLFRFLFWINFCCVRFISQKTVFATNCLHFNGHEVENKFMTAFIFAFNARCTHTHRDTLHFGECVLKSTICLPQKSMIAHQNRATYVDSSKLELPMILVGLS